MATGGRDDARILKTGTHVPNRIFVGGISENTTEEDLKTLFQKFGNVKSTKIIFDKGGISRGYGFVTFDSEGEAQRILKELDSVTLKGQRLNLGPAVKKQPFGGVTAETNPMSSPLMWSVPSYPNNAIGMPRDPVYCPQTACPFVWPPVFYQQQYSHNAQGSYPQYVYPVSPSDYSYSRPPSDCGETSSVESGESSKKGTPKPLVLAKTVLAYPSPFVMVKDEGGFLTPPPTPASEFDMMRRN